MVWVGVILFAAIGIYLIARRRQMAEDQSMMAGATIGPWVVVLEGIVFLLLAVGFFVSHQMGVFDRP